MDLTTAGSNFLVRFVIVFPSIITVTEQAYGVILVIESNFVTNDTNSFGE